MQFRLNTYIEFTGIRLFRLDTVFRTPLKVIVNGCLEFSFDLFDRCALKSDDSSCVYNISNKKMSLIIIFYFSYVSFVFHHNSTPALPKNLLI